MRATVLREVHDNSMSGHFIRRKTFSIAGKHATFLNYVTSASAMLLLEKNAIDIVTWMFSE